MDQTPAWFQLLNLDASHFERTKYAAPMAPDSKGKFRIKDENVLRKIAPNLYESAAEEVKEYNEYLAEHQGSMHKYKLGKKIGSIPLWDATLRPELLNDSHAQDKYFKEHPELLCK